MKHTGLIITTCGLLALTACSNTSTAAPASSSSASNGQPSQSVPLNPQIEQSCKQTKAALDQTFLKKWPARLAPGNTETFLAPVFSAIRSVPDIPEAKPIKLAIQDLSKDYSDAIWGWNPDTFFNKPSVTSAIASLNSVCSPYNVEFGPVA